LLGDGDVDVPEHDEELVTAEAHELVP